MTARWVYALSLGETWVRNSKSGEKVMLDVTRELAREVLDETRALMKEFEASAKLTDSQPVRLPVYVLHTPQLGEFGHILDAKLKLRGKKPGIWLNVDWNDRYEPGAFSHVSVGIDSEFTVQNGKTFGPCITELSLCSTPKDQRLGTLGEARATLAHTIIQFAAEAPVELEEMAAAIAELTTAVTALGERFTALEERVSEIAPEEDADDAGDDTPPADDAPDDEAMPVAAANDLAAVRLELAAIKKQNIELAKAIKGRERGNDGGRPPATPATPEARQAALREKGVRGAANVISALKEQR